MNEENKETRVNLAIPNDVMDIARGEAEKAGIPCVGTKIKADIVKHYRKIEERQRSREERK